MVTNAPTAATPAIHSTATTTTADSLPPPESAATPTADVVPAAARPRKSLRTSIVAWFDTGRGDLALAPGEKDRIDWVRSLPFWLMHLVCAAVVWVGWSWPAVAVAAALYAVRMFAITGFYHRYFSHRSFRTSRTCQFLFALLGSSAVQRGPLWWASHHRHHHLYSDMPEDVHSPVRHGFWWSHFLWFSSIANFKQDYRWIPDLAKFPELRFLDRFDMLAPLALALSMFGLGAVLGAYLPDLGTGAWQMLIWGFFISTVTLAHGTFTVNSLTHLFGSRRFPTNDDSRNNWLVALITFGEGWHNNHHHCQASVRQGFRWWEIDVTYYLLRAMSWIGLVWDLKPIPAKVLRELQSPGDSPPS